MRKVPLLSYVALLFSISPQCAAAEKTASSVSAEQIQEYSCVVHVHSKMSSEGRYSLPELTDLARSYKVDAIVLSDNLTETIQYGLPPLRHILWVNHGRQSISTVGVGAYLDAIRAENERQRDVLYIPGVEICPRFYWTGSIFKGDLVCHDHQRNIVAIGVGDIIERIPEARGYVWPRNALWMIATRAAFVLFVAGCVALLYLPRRLARHSGYTAGAIGRSFALGVLLPLAILCAVVNGIASLMPEFGIYGSAPSIGHGQRVIDALQNEGVVHYWAHPEARDDHDFKYAGVRFTAHTDPYPEMLVETDGYTGFGGVYEDTITLTDPGSLWDAVLTDYLAGKRKQPAWCFGEMLYHYEGQAGKKLANVETMVWATSRTGDAIVDAMRKGSFYARENDGDQKLRLSQWAADVADGGDVRIKLAVSSVRPGEKVTVKLVRNGALFKDVSATTPFELEWRDTLPPNSHKAYYRATITGRQPLKIVTNPLFARR